MPDFPQYPNAQHVLSANIRSVSANATAANGDILLVTTGAATITITLPPVGLGGPVTVKKVDAGAGAIKVVTSDGSQIDGIAGATGRTQAATEYLSWTLASDGTNWWQVW